MFTTRPEILGTFGVVASTHWIASTVGMAMLEKGGNAFDACVASAFVLQVVEPDMVGPSGEVSIVFYSARTKKVEVLCGQGTAPKGATIEHYKREGLELIPSNGLLATVIPGSFDAWMLLLRDHGTLSLREVLEPAIHYAEHGHPLLPRTAATIEIVKEWFEIQWPTSAAVFLPGGRAPNAGQILRNPKLAETYERLLREAESKGQNREDQIEAARGAFYKGFVAEHIDVFLRRTEAMDQSGSRHRGVLTADDMATWSASYETPATYEYDDFRLNKIGPWGQGPVFLQTLALLEGFDLADMGPTSTEFIHTLVEAMKLAFADREAYYGDPDFVDVPVEALLSKSYNDERRKLISVRASFELRPGKIDGYEAQVQHTLRAIRKLSTKAWKVSSEPKLGSMRAAYWGDTVHVDVVDRFGNMIAAMPSGGWLQSSPVIPELGFALNARAQMFWLEEGLPASLAPGKRPRTTLTPTLAEKGGEPYMVFGSPGGDQQEQWQLVLFLRHAHHGLSLQEAIDQPIAHTTHFPSSFHPRERMPGHLVVEETIGEKTLDALRARGHEVEVAPGRTVGCLVAASRQENGLLHGAATARLMQAYAVGR